MKLSGAPDLDTGTHNKLKATTEASARGRGTGPKPVSLANGARMSTEFNGISRERADLKRENMAMQCSMRIYYFPANTALRRQVEAAMSGATSVHLIRSD